MSDQPAPASPSRVPEAQPHGRALVAVPRMWLVALTALVVVPWLVVAGVRMWPDVEDATAVVAPGATSKASMPVKASGPWGELVVTPITISPPIEYVSRQWGELQASVWHFPPLTGDELETRLMSYGLSREDAVRLRGTARSASIGGVFVVPDAALVARLSPEVRGRLYLDLGKIAVSAGPDAPINFDQESSYRFRGDSIDSWLGGPGLSAETHALVNPYIYQQNGFLYFADIEQVRSRIPNADELQLLAKRLLRHATMLVQLRIPDTAQIGAIAEYWGRGGRRTDLQPLLESVARSSGGQSGGLIDISHLLPTLARNHLYRYPRPSVEDLQRPLLANCLWTALNFFAPVPDARYLDPPTALATLKTDYYLVQDNFQLGDVVAFTDAKGELVHVAVYIAGDLLFSKNGTSALAPWSILPIEYLKGHYVEHADDWRISYHRRNDM
jgi:hypothetical protein